MMAPHGTRFLVTGSGGFIGSHLVNSLVYQGFEVHRTIRPGSPGCGSLASEAIVHQVDLTDTVAVRALFGRVKPTAVVHAAAGRSGLLRGSIGLDPWRDTVLATEIVASTAGECGVQRFIHLGSSTEYRPSEQPLREDSVTEPITEHGRNKLEATRCVMQVGLMTGMPTVVLRLFRVYGSGENPSRLIPRIIDSLRAGTPLPLPSGTTRRDYVHVDDVVNACRLAWSHDGDVPSIINIGSGVESSVADVVATAEDVTGRRIPRAGAPFSTRPIDVRHWKADNSKAAAVMGWQPVLDLRSGLAKILASHHLLQGAAL